MDEDLESRQEDRGLSARLLVIIFLAGVAVCAVFFSLGFLVGFNERSRQEAPVAERVTASPLIPPLVNPPASEKSPGEARASTLLSSPAGAPTPRQEPIPAEQIPKPESAAPPRSAPAVAGSEAPSSPPAGPSRESAASAPEVTAGITLQVAAVRTKTDAENLVNNLRKQGYPVFLVTPEYARANDDLFRVEVGPFTSLDDANKVRESLAKQGYKAFIRR